MSRVTDVVHNISIRCPGFAEYWAEGEIAFTDDNGHASLHRTFCALSEYISTHYDRLSDADRQDFWEWIDWQSTSTDEELSNALVTCFLEDVAATEIEMSSRQFMSEALRKLFDEFAGRGRRKKRWFEK